ncbi:MAG: hypothetical protein IPG16_08425 [Comamonadaceae bacterium]|jgi:hypothetical protein|nr:hypothetical protein [Comamonadaceae bacterium]
MASPPSTGLDPQVIASIVAAVTALVAVAVAPFVTIRASKKQMLGPMRQAWINSLRDTVAEYTASIDAGIPLSSAVLAPDDSLRHAAVMDRMQRQQQVYQLKSKITLLINPKESNHIELVRLVESAYAAHLAGQNPAVAIRALLDHTQTVLKTEWNVVKG